MRLSKSDLSSFQEGIAGYERAEAANLYLQEHLSGRRPYADSLDSYFGRVYATGVAPPPNMAPYEALKARGLQVVSDESLRLQIIALYENTYSSIQRQNDFNVGVVFDVLRPYYLTHFRDLRFGQSATPIDYDVLQSDQYFMNVLVYRADFVRRAMLVYYVNAARDIETLLKRLGSELDL